MYVTVIICTSLLLFCGSFIVIPSGGIVSAAENRVPSEYLIDISAFRFPEVFLMCCEPTSSILGLYKLGLTVFSRIKSLTVGVLFHHPVAKNEIVFPAVY